MRRCVITKNVGVRADAATEAASQSMFQTVQKLALKRQPPPHTLLKQFSFDQGGHSLPSEGNGC